MIDPFSREVNGAEISWFAPLCNGDTDFLGTMPDKYKSTWKNTSAIVKRADELGYKNISVSYTHLTLPTTPYV